MTRERRDCLLTGGEDNPPVDVALAGEREQRFDGVFVVAEIANLNQPVAYREWRLIDLSSSMITTSTPRRPRLRTIPSPW